tara:strand:- start:3896 stop:4219 length:324 start_codon:yes stop_codon:yes gene_type:complete
MAKTRLFDKTPSTTTYWHDEPDGGVTINTVQDVEPVLEANKRLYNAYGDKRTTGKMGEWHLAASVPENVWDRWVLETGGDIKKDKKLLAKYLNSPEFKYFRTSPMDI